MSQPKFVHLSVHSEYALTDSLVRLPALMTTARERGMGAVAITDPHNMFALVRAQKAAQSAGIKPIMGSEVLVALSDGIERVSLIATSTESYRKLCESLSAGYTAHRDGSGHPILMLEDLVGSDLICLVGGHDSAIGRRVVDDDPVTDARLGELHKTFPGSTYIKLARTGGPNDNKYVASAVRAARRLHLPVVAVNDVRFLDRSDHASHEIRVKIASKDNSSFSGVTAEQYLKTPEEMIELFSDIPSAIANTVEIAKRASLDVPLGQAQLPIAPVPEGETENGFLVAASIEGLNKRLAVLYPDDAEAKRGPYDDRLAYELEVIKGMGFPGYFLIVADFIRWAKSKNIPVGPGRGSGAGSLVAYSLGITDLDPLEYGLLFERFLNPERVSMPDFDVDFCMDRRDEVISYVTQTYGRDAVSQIITFGTMAAKMVIRDVSRALGHPYLFGDRLAKLIPADPGIKLRDCLESQPDLLMAYESDAEAREVVDHALALEGLARQVGKHAGGVLIAPGKLTDFTPLYMDPEGKGLVSQYDKDDVEDAGLVKFDFLGLRTLTILQEAVETIHRTYPERTIDLLSLPLDDKETFELINRSETAAVFQLESHGMRKLIQDLKPSSFEEIIALVALFRPGPLQAGMVDDYISRKHGRSEVRYPHPKLATVLAPTYGVFVYQEQVMEAARVLAGYSLGQADILRKAMGKKKPEEMAKQRAVFVDGCLDASDLPAAEAGAIFDMIETFAGYGFNKSHSAAYALISFQTAYLKTHYPAEFMAAVMSSEMDHTDKLVEVLSEAARMSLTLKLPDVNVSANRFVVNKKGSIVYGLAAIKSVGSKIVDTIVNERTVNGPYDSPYDLCRRTGIDKRALQALGKAGALDQFGEHRGDVMAKLENALGAAKQTKKASVDQADMFGLGGDMLQGEKVPAWSLKAILKAELESFGCFVSGHPMTPYKDELEPILSGTFRSVTQPEEDGSKARERNVILAGYVVVMQVKTTQRGSYARVRMDDGTAQFELFVPAKLFASNENMLKAGETLIIDGKLEVDDYNGGHRVSAKEIRSLDQFREAYARRLVVEMPREILEQGMARLTRLLTTAPPGPATVEVQLTDEDGSKESVTIDCSIVPTIALTDALEECFGPSVRVETSPSSTPRPTQAQKARLVMENARPKEVRHQEMEKLFEAAGMLMS